MATATDFSSHTADVHNESPVWTRFTSNERDAMRREDLFAGRSVSLVLSSVVAVGLLGLTLIVLAGLPHYLASAAR